MKSLLQDIAILSVWFVTCTVFGIILNEMSAKPIGLGYSLPERRLDRIIEGLKPSFGSVNIAQGDLDVNQVSKVSSERSALILDARPAVFYSLGHIPLAVSLPRDDFEAQYKHWRPWLESFRQKPIIVYCSERDCRDSQIVAETLQKLGYGQVHLFRGGWHDWQSMNLPEEKSE